MRTCRKTKRLPCVKGASVSSRLFSCYPIAKTVLKNARHMRLFFYTLNLQFHDAALGFHAAFFVEGDRRFVERPDVEFDAVAASFLGELPAVCDQRGSHATAAGFRLDKQIVDPQNAVRTANTVGLAVLDLAEKVARTGDVGRVGDEDIAIFGSDEGGEIGVGVLGAAVVENIRAAAVVQGGDLGEHSDHVVIISQGNGTNCGGHTVSSLR